MKEKQLDICKLEFHWASLATQLKWNNHLQKKCEMGIVIQNGNNYESQLVSSEHVSNQNKWIKKW